MAMSTRSRIGYFGSCSKVRSRPRRTARQEGVFWQRRRRLVNAQEDDALDQRVADRAGHHDRPACLPRQRDEGPDVEAGDSAGFAGIPQRLGRVAEPSPDPLRRRKRTARRKHRPKRRNMLLITARPRSPTRWRTLPI